ncbi:MAG: PAS domain-containing protein [Blastocatellia bacterium]|nr:PAS domain-containing protein [Blastocatellia bacterium]
MLTQYFKTLSFCKLVSIFCFLIGITNFIGWGFSIESLLRITPAFAAMQPNTAICFILSSFMLWASISNSSEVGNLHNKQKSLIYISSMLIMLISLLSLGEYLLKGDLGLDHVLFWRPFKQVGNTRLGPMAPMTAINFILLSVAFFSFTTKVLHKYATAQILTLTTGFLSLLSITGYAYHSVTFYGQELNTQIALHTAISLLVLSFGIFWIYPNNAIASILNGSYYGSTVARRLLPVAIFMPLVLGWIRLKGQDLGFYDTEFGLTIYAITTIVFFTSFILWQAWTLNQNDVARRKIEMALKESEEKLQAILNNSPSIIYLKDLEGRFILMNEPFEKEFQIPRKTLVGKSMHEVFPKEAADEYLKNDKKVIETKKALIYEETAPHQNGARTYLSVKFPIFDADGKPYALAGISTDITKRKKLEEDLRKLTEELEKKVEERTKQLELTNKQLQEEILEHKKSRKEIEKLNVELEKRVLERTEQLNATNKELEAFSYSVSHDLRAPLRHINGFIQLLEKHATVKLDEKGNRYIKIISEAAQKMGVLIDELLAFSRMGKQDMSTTIIELGEIVKEAVKTQIEMSGKDNITWIINDLPKVDADAAMLRVVLNNLISNAIKYSSTCSTPVIEIGSETSSMEEIIFIRDNGVGFDMQYANKLFGVFQRLHRADEFEGVGIGLATVRRIIHRHKGKVWAESKLNEGATFYFSLPKIN